MDNFITYLEASQQQQSANKVLRDTKLIPRLVLEAELFSKHVILLANKTKMNYQQYLSLGTARDFRIKAPVLIDALRTRQNDEQPDITEAETEILSPAQSEHEEEEGSDQETSRSKRRRLS
ncbi:hypothetical protein O0L34_g5044 [Tuta absoluta]|nr:hypothetical protein O0L34_g5044 [Tuta absoluta]